MLRGSALQRDGTSICAFCRHRLSQRLAPPRHRAFSGARWLWNDSNSGSAVGGGDSPGPGNALGPTTPPRRLVGPRGGGGSWGKPTFASRLQERSDPITAQQSGELNDNTGSAVGGASPSSGNALGPAPPRPPVSPVGGGGGWGKPTFASRLQTSPGAAAQQGSVLNEHELSARSQLLARQNVALPRNATTDIPKPREMGSPQRQSGAPSLSSGPGNSAPLPSSGGLPPSALQKLGEVSTPDPGLPQPPSLLGKTGRPPTVIPPRNSFAQPSYEERSLPQTAQPSINGVQPPQRDNSTSDLAETLHTGASSPNEPQRPDILSSNSQPAQDRPSPVKRPVPSSAGGWGSMAWTVRSTFPDDSINRSSTKSQAQSSNEERSSPQNAQRDENGAQPPLQGNATFSLAETLRAGTSSPNGLQGPGAPGSDLRPAQDISSGIKRPMPGSSGGWGSMARTARSAFPEERSSPQNAERSANGIQPSLQGKVTPGLADMPAGASSTSGPLGPETPRYNAQVTQDMPSTVKKTIPSGSGEWGNMARTVRSTFPEDGIDRPSMKDQASVGVNGASSPSKTLRTGGFSPSGPQGSETPKVNLQSTQNIPTTAHKVMPGSLGGLGDMTGTARSTLPGDGADKPPTKSQGLAGGWGSVARTVRSTFPEGGIHPSTKSQASASGWGSMARTIRSTFPEDGFNRPSTKSQTSASAQPWDSFEKQRTNGSRTARNDETFGRRDNNIYPIRLSWRPRSPLSDNTIYSPQELDQKPSTTNSTISKGQPDIGAWGGASGKAEGTNPWGLPGRKATPASNRKEESNFWGLLGREATRENNTTEDSNSWGLLARKAAPEKTNSDDFWAAMTKIPQDGRGSQSKVQDEWDKVIDQKFEKGSRAKVQDDWGKEFDKKVEYRKPDPYASKEEPKFVLGDLDSAPGIPSSASTDNRWAGNYVDQPGEEQKAKGRDREKREMQDPFEDKKSRKGRGKSGKSSRSDRYDEDEMYEEDDVYDPYEEKRRLKAERKAKREAARKGPTSIRLPELISINALAEALKVKPDVFLQQLGELGFEGVTLDSIMAGETAALVAMEYGFEPTVDLGASRDLRPRPSPEDPSVLPPRPPVVTIMGHVDHGKTTLLDYLRKSSVAAQEHGGITQHIGAFSVSLSSGKVITFLDTPGHAAFLTMRERGAQVTDIVVLVVAADDSVKPQTLEALRHARTHKVPIIVAINKVDTDGANIDQVKADLARSGVEIEDYGGDVQVVLVSGKTGQGMEDLEENILTLSEILDMRAERDGPAEGWVLESSLKPIGKTATVLVKRGTLRPGDYIAAGMTWARIRSMRNEAGNQVKEAPPGTPVEILGWKELPAAGDEVIQGEDEGRVKDAAEYRESLRDQEKDAADYETIAETRRQHQEKRAREKAALEESGIRAPLGGNWNSRKASQYIQAKQQAAEAAAAAAESAEGAEGEGTTKMVNFIVKGDVHGSVEAVCAAIQEVGSHEVQPRVLRSGTGSITEFDVEHAAMSSSVIINFAAPISGHIRRLAEDQGVRILDHNVIYHLIDDVKNTLSSYLAPEISSKVLGEAEVLQIFPINLKGRQYKNIAGCRVRNGVVSKGALYRVFRGGKKIFDGTLETLKHAKKDVTEMRKGAECGMGFEDFQDLEVGDQIQAYEEIRTERKLS
ncbi:hypothetical protein DL769_004072 [Monosporascus sp. CRB-8-3]|nr:hypothetical protein DL769_004072 [Monosporascus sp. CRB-8-3]